MGGKSSRQKEPRSGPNVNTGVRCSSTEDVCGMVETASPVFIQQQRLLLDHYNQTVAEKRNQHIQGQYQVRYTQEYQTQGETNQQRIIQSQECLRIIRERREQQKEAERQQRNLEEERQRIDTERQRILLREQHHRKEIKRRIEIVEKVSQWEEVDIQRRLRPIEEERQRKETGIQRRLIEEERQRKETERQQRILEEERQRIDTERQRILLREQHQRKEIKRRIEIVEKVSQWEGVDKQRRLIEEERQRKETEVQRRLIEEERQRKETERQQRILEEERQRIDTERQRILLREQHQRKVVKRRIAIIEEVSQWEEVDIQRRLIEEERQRKETEIQQRLIEEEEEGQRKEAERQKRLLEKEHRQRKELQKHLEEHRKKLLEESRRKLLQDKLPQEKIPVEWEQKNYMKRTMKLHNLAEEHVQLSKTQRKRETYGFLHSAILRNSLAANWDPMPPNKTYVRVPVREDTDEFRTVNNCFKSTTQKGFDVNKIERVQNPFLLGCYILKKLEMENMYGARNVEEKILFRGAFARFIDKNCENNFNWRNVAVSKRNIYGEGFILSPISYFANKYADKETRNKVMFVVRVLVSKVTEAIENMEIPPLLNNRKFSDVLRFDTTKRRDDRVIVKFADNEFYLDYIIHYTVDPELQTKVYTNKNSNEYTVDDDFV
ncbi:hypothetical protein L9F63_022798 [Diploptera punctata]|uniref:PARP catalytic domain-containing protein n=1 Tax=Diploptera punctata TaxID=6984 RepID=A0AAD8EAL6_DIPPU|nr:hypothetical protein L9F63_022798 [Diploptera punctata]